MQDTEAEKKEIKRRFQLWIRPSTLELADTLYKKDNCDSRSEFIEKAVIFYAGYLSAEDNKTYLPNIVTSTLKSIVAESDHRQNRMLFKLAVELAVMMNVVAANNNIDPVSLDRLRGRSELAERMGRKLTAIVPKVCALKKVVHLRKYISPQKEFVI